MTNPMEPPSPASPGPEKGPPPVVELRGVTQVFPGNNGGSPTTALQDVSFTVEDTPGTGEFVVFLGPSGCGKSTILNLIAGLAKPSVGEVRVRGLPVRGPGPDRGFVFQNYAAFPWRTARENVEFGLQMAHPGLAPGVQRILADSHLKAVGLEGRETHYPRQLSGGMRQRLALARTLATQPSIVLMDEPFGALDVRIRLDMQDLLGRMWRERESTVLFVTHDVGEAVYLADTIYLLAPSPGSVVETVTVQERHPRERPFEKTPRFREMVDYLTARLRSLARTEGVPRAAVG